MGAPETVGGVRSFADEGIACITVPGLVGDYVVYLRGFNTGLQTARQVMMGEAEQIARITEQIDNNLDPIADTTTDNYWLNDESPLEVIDPSGWSIDGAICRLSSVWRIITG